MIRIVCDTCGRVMGTMTRKKYRDKGAPEVCNACIKREADMLKFFDDVKTKYIHKMELFVNDFKEEVVKGPKKSRKKSK